MFNQVVNLDKKNLKEIFTDIDSSEYSSILVIVYFSKENYDDYKLYIKKIKEVFPKSHICGLSGGGTINNDFIDEQNVIANFIFFKKTVINLQYYKFSKSYDEYFEGLSSGRKLYCKDMKLSMIFISDLNNKYNFNSSAFLQGLHDSIKLPVVGGIAGDCGRFMRTFVFAEDEFIEDGAILIGFSGKELDIDIGYVYNFKPIGKKMTVTKSEGKRVYEINNMDVKTLYDTYFGDSLVSKLPTMGAHFPLLVKSNDEYYSRIPLQVFEDGSFLFSSPLIEGQEVQFSYGIVDEMINRTKALSNKLTGDVFLLISCMGRKLFSSQKNKSEIDSFSKSKNNVSGFFSYGEIITIEDNVKLLHQAFIAIGLRESDKTMYKPISVKQVEDEDIQIDDEKKDLFITNAVVNLLQTLTKELYSKDSSLQKIEDRLANITKQIGDGLTVIDEDGLIKYINEGAKNILNMNEEIINMHLWEVLILSQNNTFDIKSIFKYPLDYIVNRTDEITTYKGEIKFLSYTATPDFTENGDFKGYVFIFQDVTKEIEKEKKLQLMNNFLTAYKKALDNSSIVNKMLPDGTITYVNEEFCKKMGYSEEEIIGKTHQMIRSPETDKQLINDIYEIIYQKKVWKGVVDYKTKNGDIIYTVLTVVPILDENNNISEFVLIRNDITELKKAIEKAEVAKEAKSRFLANMSHEIRTPLNSILGFIDVLKNSELNDKQKRYIDIMKSSASNLLGILNDILDFSKIEQGKLVIENIKFKPKFEFKTVIDLFVVKAKEKQIEISYDIDNRIPNVILGDPLRIKQVLINLMGNALKFTNIGGKIILKIKMIEYNKPNNNVKLKFIVKDNGVGIAKDKLEQIFEAFNQEDTSTTRVYGGTGLGLSISSSLIQAMNGKLDVSSTKNEGSEFSFDLILEVPEDDNMIFEYNNKEFLSEKDFESDENIKDYDLLDLDIIVAEDNENNQELIKTMFEQMNISVTIVSNGQELFEKMKERYFSLFFIDINMPIMDGKEVIRKIKKTANCQGRKFIALSGVSTKEGIQEIFESGFDHYISKPFSYAKLKNEVENFYGVDIKTICKKNSKKEDDLLYSDETKKIIVSIDKKIADGNIDVAKIFISELKEAIGDQRDNLYRYLEEIEDNLENENYNFYLIFDEIYKMF